MGSTVRVTLTKKQSNRLAAVPPSAILYDSKGSYVYVVGAGNRVEKRAVKLGNSSESWQLIRSGLKPGETIIVEGVHKTMPGAEVEPVPVRK